MYLCYRHRSRRPRALRREASSVERQLSFRKAFGLRQGPCLGQAPMCQDSVVGLGAPERTGRSRRGGAQLRHRDRGAVISVKQKTPASTLALPRGMLGEGPAPEQGRAGARHQLPRSEPLDSLAAYLTLSHSGSCPRFLLGSCEGPQDRAQTARSLS